MAYRIVLLALLLVARPVLAQGVAGPPAPQTKAAAAKPPAADADDDEEGGDEIVVSGRRQLRGALVTDIPPEVQLNTRAVRALGVGSLDEVLDELTPQTRSDRGGDDPIVLVNGKRIAAFSSIRDFPPEAVRRIEVFPEEVALQYGYRPDQRVVNVVLRKRFRALTLLGRYTVAPDRGRNTYRAKADLLRIDDSGRMNLDIDYRHEDPVFGDHARASDDAARAQGRSLAAQTDRLVLNAGLNRSIGAVSADLNGRVEVGSAQSQLGLSRRDQALSAAQGRILDPAPLYRSADRVEAQANLTLNGQLAHWQWSFAGKVDAATERTRTQAARAFDDIRLGPPGLLSDNCGAASIARDGCTSTAERTASATIYVNGTALTLPAGPATAALRVGVSRDYVRARSPLLSPAGVADEARTEANGQIALDIPITRRAGGGFGIGKLSANANVEVAQLSDFGSLAKAGGGLIWSPIDQVTLTSSFNDEQQAPSVAQLGGAPLATPDDRAFDFTRGETVIVTDVTGGDARLRPQHQQVASVRLQVRPLAASNLALTVDYESVRARHAIADVSLATAALDAAFPDRFQRDGAGRLIAIARTPVNLRRRDRQQLRFGVNLTRAFGGVSVQPVSADASAKPTLPSRGQIQLSLYDTLHVEDEVTLRSGLPKLDLLDGDALGDRGGTPRHQIELQAIATLGAVSVNSSLDWQTRTRVRSAPIDAGLDGDALLFSQGVRLDLKLQVDLGASPLVTRTLPWLHGNLNLSMNNVLNGHRRVVTNTGAVPLGYRSSTLDPVGRAFRLTFRKRFK